MLRRVIKTCYQRQVQLTWSVSRTVCLDLNEFSSCLIATFLPL